jgi:serine/threonine protein kinase
VHNDLKLENILVGKMNGDEMNKLRIIDFGLSSTYLKNGVHRCPKEFAFRGNIAFCSRYAMLQKTRSRRDDMTSLVYVLFYLLRGNLSFLGIN